MAAPAFNTIYTHYSDEVARLADTIEIENDTSPSLSGGDDYAPEVLVDDNPAKVAKINETDGGSPAVGLVSGAWIFSYSAPQPIAVAGLIHHSFDETESVSPGSPAPSVRLEGNSTSDFSNPEFSAAFTIPPWLGTGTGRWPQNPWLNLTEQSGYTAEGFQFWRLVIENNSQNIQLGQVVFGSTLRQFDPDLRWGLRINADKPQIENRTSFGVSTIYARGTTIWNQEADILLTDDMRDALEAHWYDVEGRARPWLLIPSGPGDPTRCYLVRYTMTEIAEQWQTHETFSKRLQFQEVGRGLRPGV
jgi:hypothetical protein